MGCQCSKATPADQPVAKPPPPKAPEPAAPPQAAGAKPTEQAPPAEPERVPEPPEDTAKISGVKSAKSVKSTASTLPRGYTAEAEELLKALDSKGNGFVTFDELQAKFASGDLLLGPNLHGHSKQELVHAVKSLRSNATAGSHTADAEAILDGQDFLTMRQLWELLESGELEVGPRLRRSKKGTAASDARGYTAEAEEILKALDAGGKGFVTLEELQNKLDAGDIELGPRMRYDSNLSLVSAARSYRSTGTIPRGFTADAEALLQAGGDGPLSIDQLRALIADGEIQLGPHAGARATGRQVSNVKSMQSIPRGYTADAEAIFRAVDGELTVDQLEGLLDCGELHLGPRLQEESAVISKRESVAPERQRVSTVSVSTQVAAEAEALLAAAGGRLTVGQLEALLDAGEVQAGPRLRRSLLAASQDVKAAPPGADLAAPEPAAAKPAKKVPRKKKKDQDNIARDFVAEARRIMQALDAAGTGKITVEEFRAAISAGTINLGIPLAADSPRVKRALDSPTSATDDGAAISDSDAPKKIKKVAKKKKVRSGPEEKEQKGGLPGEESVVAAAQPLPAAVQEHPMEHGPKAEHPTEDASKVEALAAAHKPDVGHDGRTAAEELAPDPARRFTAEARELLQALDTKGDGVVTADELAKGLREGKLDAHHGVEPDEVRPHPHTHAHAEPHGQGAAHETARRFTAEARELLQALDALGKGHLTVDELAKGLQEGKLDAHHDVAEPDAGARTGEVQPHAHRSAEHPGTEAASHDVPRRYTAEAMELLRAPDTKGDGSVTVDELARALREGRLDAHHADQDGADPAPHPHGAQACTEEAAPDGPRRYTAEAMELLRSLSTKGDGVLTLDELVRGIQEGEVAPGAQQDGHGRPLGAH